MSEREVLVNNIQKHFMLNDSLGDFGNRTYQFTVNEIADFVLADRKRICAPLLELKETAKSSAISYDNYADIAIKDVLQLAGLSKDKD